ncbi:MAG: transketolase [Alphaproteobacteria bacterium]
MKNHNQAENMESIKNYKKMANAIRALSMDAVENAKSGHPGMPMGMADVATILFAEFLKFNPKEPNWYDRDRFILSAGHGSMLLYSLLYLTGYKDINIEEIKNYRTLKGKTAGHPEYGYLSGIETTTGPLGQGLANAVGMAVGEKMLASRYPEITDHYTYVIAGDGCLMEGISQEAISFAGHLGLGKLIILFDDNNISIDGPTNLTVSDDQITRFQASNWHTQSIDGHDFGQIRNAIQAAKASDKPSLIACKTIIGYGAGIKAGSEKSHGSPLGMDEVKKARDNLNWPYSPFEVPNDIMDSWNKVGQRGGVLYDDWCRKWDMLDRDEKDEITRILNGDLSLDFADEINKVKEKLTEDKQTIATRKSSGIVLERLVRKQTEMIGGSADLTGSNDTKTADLLAINKDNFNGRYIHYGVREHIMAAIMNGIALHKGFIPYGGTFLAFSDYARPAIRLSALMKLRVIYVMTHDSIGLGEDGPTHQPIEHLASLRSIPNLLTIRPADSVEVAEAWQIALEHKSTPSIIALSRQELPLLRNIHIKENLSAKGAYIISEYKNDLKVTIIATGSEVAIAIEIQEILHSNNIGTRVISMPCTELFDKQDKEYKSYLLGNDSIKVGIEAASSFGWERYIGQEGLFFGIDSFGACGSAQELYKYFNITPENISSKILDKLNK